MSIFTMYNVLTQICILIVYYDNIITNNINIINKYTELSNTQSNHILRTI